jgi:hypothetical protein
MAQHGALLSRAFQGKWTKRHFVHSKNHIFSLIMKEPKQQQKV